MRFDRSLQRPGIRETQWYRVRDRIGPGTFQGSCFWKASWPLQREVTLLSIEIGRPLPTHRGVSGREFRFPWLRVNESAFGAVLTTRPKEVLSCRAAYTSVDPGVCRSRPQETLKTLSSASARSRMLRRISLVLTAANPRWRPSRISLPRQ